MLIFNESQQATVCVKASDILAKATHKAIDVNLVPQTKVDGIIELSYCNCFDISTDQYGRVMTLGFDVLSQLIAKLNFSVYDGDETALRYSIGNYLVMLL